jgi:ribonuclease T2
MDLRSKLRYGLMAIAIVTTVTSAAMAQRPYGPRGSADANNVAGKFDYYALVLSWSPSHCAGVGADRDAMQCARTDGKRFSFVLHGLWPQNSPRGWPQDCPVKGRAFVPRPVINNMLDIMPSDKLVIHEYRKHGTCSGLEPNAYFDLSRKLFSMVTIPEEYRNTFEAKFVSPAEMVSEFVKVNPWLKPNMIAVDCGGTGNRVGDVRICFSKEGQPTACSRNEDQRKMCSAAKMYLPPVRSTRNEDAVKPQPAPQPAPMSKPSGRNI